VDTGQILSLEEWQFLGYDLRSLAADPLFVDPERGDFRLRPESPALVLGIQLTDPDQIGIRPGRDAAVPIPSTPSAQ